MSSNPLFSQQTGHKYTFQLQLRKIFISPSLPFQVKIVWARGENRIESQNPIKLQPPQNEVMLQECFCNKSTVLFNPKKLQFRKKQSRIQVILYANGSPKQGGEVVLNLCQILDPYNIKKQQEKIYKLVTRQQKPRVEIEFKLTAEYCQQMIRDEQRSIGSGVGSISSKNTTAMGYANSDAKHYVQKKNLFLYEAPSKDNQSVISYNSYSTNMMRYQSGAKKDRQDSLRKEEYGLGITTRKDLISNVDNMFNKTTSVNMKSVSGQYDTRSREGYNRVTQPQFDNRTQNFDNPSHKLLQQEQSKRSKLQAQVSRLNIYMKEQSNKLTEYIQQNTRLKQQLNRMGSQQQQQGYNKSTVDKQTSLIKQQFQEQVDRLKSQNEDIKRRTFQMSNQNRQLHHRLDMLVGQREKINQEMRALKLQKERAQARFQSLNKNIQGIVANKENSSKEVENLKDQLEHIKSLNLTLRQTLQKERRKTQQLQFNNNYQKSSIEDNYKKIQQRLYQVQRENASLLTQVRERENEIDAKKQLLYRLEKTSNQYKEKILVSQSQKSRFLLENASLKNQSDKMRLQLANLRQSLAKVRDDKAAQYEQKNTQLQSLSYQQLQRIRSLQFEVQQSKKTFSQVSVMNDTIKKQLEDQKNEIYRLEANMKGLKEIQGKYYNLEKVYVEKQRENAMLKQESGRMLSKMSQAQEKCTKLSTENEQLRRKSISTPDVNQILRESVQMQVQLKFKTDQMIRLKNIQQKFNQVVYRLQMQQKNRKQLQEEMQRLQKQVKQKNKLYLIEVQKGKIFLNEKMEIEKTIDQIKTQLKRCQDIIFNGDRQVKEMEQHINYITTENNQLKNKLANLQGELSSLRLKQTDTSRLQTRVKQLQQQCNDKLLTMNLMTNNLATAQKRIHELQYLAKDKETQFQEELKKAQSASQKLILLQSTQSSISNELHKTLTQKKSLEMKCETIMQELHSLKKQYEDEKLRSTSVVSLRSNEDQMKIRQLQNELQKKDKQISKLTKEKLQIQQENINLHVQVMKKLSEMEKNKDSTPGMESTITPK